MVSIAVSKVFDRIKAGEPRTFGSLRVIPLGGPSRRKPAYRLYGPKLAKGVALTEMTEAGEVPNIRVENHLDVRVLLIDGQELVGARQNRIMNTDVLVGAHTKLGIPVSCVESGRWKYRTPAFSSGVHAHRSCRASSSTRIYCALKARLGHLADQPKVWQGVDELMYRLCTKSATFAVSDVYAQQKKKLAEIRSALGLPPRTIGFAVYHGDRFLGLDLFDRVSTLRRAWKSLLDSYAIDWLAFESDADDPPESPKRSPSVEQLIESFGAAEWEQFETPGEGSHLRWESDDLTASTLVWQESGTALHLQAFPREARPLVAPRRYEPAIRHAVAQREGEPAGRRCRRCGFLYGLVATAEGDYCNHCGHERTAPSRRGRASVRTADASRPSPSPVPV